MIKFLNVAIALLIYPILLCSQPLGKGEADSLYVVFRYSVIEDYQATLDLGLRLRRHYIQVKDSCKNASLSTKIAKCYERLGNIDSALHVLHKSERTSLNCKPEDYLINIIGQASIYIELELWEQVITVIDQAIQKVEGALPDSAFNEILVNKAIALVYQGRIGEAKSIFRKYYNNALAAENVSDQLTALSNLGALSGYTEDLDSAEFYLEKALVLCGKHPCPGILEILQNLATLASYKDDFELSKYYLDSAISTAQRQNDI